MSIFDLPSSARPGKDTPVGQDELGRMVYRTVTGQQYTMPEAPSISPRPSLPMQGPPAYAAPERMAEMGDYAASLGRMQGGYSADDLSAAGFSPMEVIAFTGASRASTATPIDTAREEELYGALQEPDYTMRENATARVRNALIEQVGMNPYQAGVYARRIMGDPNAAGVLESMGLIDVASALGGGASVAAKGIGLAGRAIAAAPAALSGMFNVEEGSQATARGYDAGSALQTGLGALQFVGGMAEMFPAGKLIAKGIARNVSRMDPNTLYSVFGPPMPARAPETGSGSGRPPVTFDDVERAMSKAEPKGAAVKPKMGEAFDDWIDRIYLPENRGPQNVVQDENVVFRAMSPWEAKAGEEIGVFRDLSGQPLYVANDPERYIGGGAYGGKRQGRIYEFDVTGLASEVRQGGVGIQERAISEIPTDRVRRVWEWNPDTKAHELIVDNTQMGSSETFAPTGIKAYHGSPHDFDKFSMSKIGTGEGAQAYGHGLYFAENEGIARGYRDALSDRSAKLGEFVKASGEKLDVLDAPDGFYSLLGEQPDNTSYDQLLKAAQEKLEWAKTRKGGLRDELSRKAQSVLDFVKENEGIKFERNPDRGRMYEVNINANPEDFLDWDKPLREQPEVAKRLGYSDAAVIAAEKAKLYKAFQPPKGDTFEDLFAPLSAQEKAAAEKLAFMPEPWNEMTGKDAWLRAAQRRFSVMQDDGRWGPGAKTYEEALQMANGDINKVRTLSDPSHQSRAEFMREAGVPGIKYFDAMSRGAGEGSRNYVVFDENLIEIVRKYGIAGAATILGVSALDVEQAIAANVPQSEWDQLVAGPR